MPKPWYIDGFGEHYLELYAHRNEAEAAQSIALLAGSGQELAGRSILDLGCGGGRHLRVLHRHGARALGLDLSWPLLAAARRQLSRGQHLLRGDMRQLPFSDRAFDGVLSMFTSFGYFRADAENWRVLEEVARILKGGGFFYFDFLNRSRVLSDLQRESRRDGERFSARESRRIEDERVIKTVRVTERDSGKTTLSYEESVRLFRPEEIRARLAERGLVERAVWGNYRGEAFEADSSPRLLLLTQRAST